MHHLDKSAHHLLASVEVGNHTVAQGAYDADAIVGLLIHQLGTSANGYHFFAMPVESHHRRFVHGNLIVTDNDGIGRTQVDGQLLRERK